MSALGWTKEADGRYRSGRFLIEREGRWWTLSYDGQETQIGYRALWLAQNAAEGWLRNHPEHGLRVIRGGREDGA